MIDIVKGRIDKTVLLLEIRQTDIITKIAVVLQALRLIPFNLWFYLYRSLFRREKHKEKS